jgi:hypothetical protein
VNHLAKLHRLEGKFGIPKLSVPDSTDHGKPQGKRA